MHVIVCAFVYGWPIYKCTTKIDLLSWSLKNTCFYDGKAYTVGIVIETAPGIKCECSSARDTAASWIEAHLS